MLPCFSMNYLIQGGGINSKLFSKSFADAKTFCIKSPNLSHMIAGKLGFATLFSSCRQSSSFAFSVLHIIFMCSQKQMLRSYASRIIAFMTNTYPGGNWANVYFPRNSMGWSHFLIYFKRAISTMYSAACAAHPLIASMKRYKLDLLPKSILNFFGVNHGK